MKKHMPWDNKEVIELTREQLYQQVWETPMQKLAKEYNLSDVGLAKICKKHRIARPPRGYWAKKEFGKPTHQIKLPKLKDESLQTIHIYKRSHQAAGANECLPLSAYDEDLALLMSQAMAMPKIDVPDRIGRYHPLIQAHRKSLRDHEVSYENREPTLNMDVSRDCRKRTYRILNILFNTIERLGGEIEVLREHGKDTTYIRLAGENAASLRLKEKTRPVDHVPQKENELFAPKYDYVLTGLLKFELERTWLHTLKITETAISAKFEDRINDLIIRLIESAQEGRNKRLEWEAVRKERQDLENRRVELSQKQREEQARIERLMGQAHNWKEAGTIRAYVEATKRAVLAEHDHIDEGSEFDLWYQWGLQQADRLDPLKESPPSILDEQL